MHRVAAPLYKNDTLFVADEVPVLACEFCWLAFADAAIRVKLRQSICRMDFLRAS
jgi:hypothetical protein